MIRRSIPSGLFIGIAAAGIAVVVMLYAGLSVRQTRINPTQNVMPGVKQFAEGFTEITKTRGKGDSPKPSWLANDLRATYYRLFLGLTVGTIASIVIGIGMGAYPAAEAFFSPTINFMAKIPPTAMIAVYMIVFHTNLKMYVALVAFGVFFTMVQAIYQSVQKDVPGDLIDKAYTLGASEFEIIVEVIWPQVLPRVLENIRLHLGPAMVFLIAAEMLFASEGFGYTIRLQQRLMNMNVVYIYLAILGVSGLLIDWALIRLRRFLCPWFGA